MSAIPPLVITAAGAQPSAPADLRATLVAAVTTTNPGFTANLPASLIEDVTSTSVGALIMCDQARVDTINSLSPAGSNPFLTMQLGGVYGTEQGADTNTSVYVVFDGTIGFPIAVGFTVSDGTYQYTVQDGGIIASNGLSAPLFCVATQAGSWAVAQNTVNQLVTSVPSTITLSCNNPTDGTPGAAAQPIEDYQAQVLQAGVAASQGMTRYLKTLLGNVAGVQKRLVSARQITGGGWEVIVGGGDPYEVANAIFEALFDISTLTGSVMSVAGITQANPGVVTTVLNHGYTTGQAVAIADANPPAYNGTYTATVIDEKTFSIGVDTTADPAYVGGGVLTPNSRNIVVPINDYPDTYLIPIVLPPQQSVAITLLWGTSALNAISDPAVAQLGVPALVNYVNSIPVGAPMNLYQLQNAFQTAVASLIPTELLTRMAFAVSINGVGVTPEAGTGIIAGDPESYFFTTSTSVIVSRG